MFNPLGVLVRSSVALAVLALGGPAFAQPAFGRGPQERPGGAAVFVAPNGFVLTVTSATTTSGSTTTTSYELSALNATGGSAWSYNAPNRIQHLVQPANLVAFSFETAATGTTPASATIVAVSLASGSKVWSQSFDGAVTMLAANGTGLIAVVATAVPPTGNARHGSITRTLYSLDAAGNTVWKSTLD